MSARPAALHVVELDETSRDLDQAFEFIPGTHGLIEQIAVRVLAGLESGSFRQVAARHGLQASALHAAVHRFADRLGLRWTRSRVEARTAWRLAAARRRSQAVRNKAAAEKGVTS